MGSITRSHSFVSGEKPTESEWNVDIDQLFTLVAGQLDTNNVDTTSSDGISVLNANQTVSGTRSHSGAVTITNDVDLIFGTDSDIKIRYDETTDDALRIDTGVENAPLAIVLKADQGDDAGDAWKVNLAAAAGVLTFGNDIASKGSYVTQLTLTPHATVASSTTAIAGHATVGGNLTVTGGVTVAGASAFDIGDSDKLLLGDSDDLTVYHDGSNSYITNATGALKIATETSGIAVTIGHTTSETTIADNATVTGTLGAGASTLASLICTAAATFGGGTGSSGATITTDGAGTFDGILKTEDATDATSTTDGSLQTDGGLSVAKDAILGNDVKLLTDSSVLSLGVGSDATLTHDGTTGVTIAANPVIVDSGDALTLDAHTGIFVFKDAGSEVLRFTEGNSGDVTIKLATNAKDLVFTDNGDATNMKILDAAAGINVPGEVQTTKIAYTDGDDAITIADGGGVTTSSTLSIGTVAAAGEDTDKFLVLDSSGNVDYRTGTQVLSDIGGAGSGSSTAADDISAGDGAVSIETTSGNITIDAQANDADVIIKVDDGGTSRTAVTFDGSENAVANFYSDINVPGEVQTTGIGYTDGDNAITIADGGGVTFSNTVTVGVDDTGHDVKFFGATSGNYLEWDESADQLNVLGTAFINSGATRPIAEFTSSHTNRMIVVSADTETANDTVGIAFNATASSAIGSTHSIAAIEGKVTQAGTLKGDLIFHVNAGDSYTESMRLDSAGNMLLGGTTTTTNWTASGKLFIEGAIPGIGLRDTTGSADDWMIVNSNGTLTIANDTDNTQPFKITDAGLVGINGTPTVPFHIFSAVAGDVVQWEQTNTSGSFLRFRYNGITPDNNTVHFLHGSDGTANRVYIYSDGDLANHDGTYGTISDVKLKQDITDVRSYWDDFKSLQYRKFRHKTDVEANADAPYRLGLVAQEVETVFPTLVPESPDPDIETEEAVVDEDGVAVLDEEGNPTYETISTPSGTTHKWVKSSIIEGPIMGSVVQELQTRLEAAEAKIATLESA